MSFDIMFFIALGGTQFLRGTIGKFPPSLRIFNAFLPLLFLGKFWVKQKGGKKNEAQSTATIRGVVESEP